MDKKTRHKRSWIVRLLISFIGGWIVIALYVSGAAGGQNFFREHGKKVERGIRAYEMYVDSPSYTGASVGLTPELLELAEKEGAEPDVIRATVGAALSEGIKSHHLIGFLKIESHYCQNIGGGVALTEVLARIQREIAKGAGPKTIDWWRYQAEALHKIANYLLVEVLSIPGSFGAGAISCMQVMPGNWWNLKGGDYRRPYEAARVSAKYLNQTGYKEHGFEYAVRAYNRGGGQAYVDKVMAAAALWEDAVKGVTLYDPIVATWWQKPVILVEFIAIAVTGEGDLPTPGTGPPIVGEFAHPYPGSVPCKEGNWFGRVIGDYTHWAQDFCTGTVSPVYAAHDCVVTVSKWISIHDWDTIKWSSSGNTVVCEGELEDGKKIETIYGHVNGDVLPAVGTFLPVGEYLGTTGCSGKDDEYCTGPHLHFGSKIDGKWRDPLIVFKAVFE